MILPLAIIVACVVLLALMQLVVWQVNRLVERNTPMTTTATIKAPKPLTLQPIRPGNYKSSGGRFEVLAAPSANGPKPSTKVWTGPTSPIFHQPDEGAMAQRTQ